MISYASFQEIFQESSKILSEKKSETVDFIDREVKLKKDLELDRFFRTQLEKLTSLPVYSEESLGDFPNEQSECWIVDPLDGSLNFQRGIPFFTSSICLWKKGSPILGAIYDYSHQDFYFASPQSGLVVNDFSIQPISRNSLKHLKAVGIPSYSSISTSLQMFSESLNQYKKLRWLGCASLSLAYVACGKMDAYEELGIKIWDVAAGIALVKASGGSVQYTLNQDQSLDLHVSAGAQHV